MPYPLSTYFFIVFRVADIADIVKVGYKLTYLPYIFSQPSNNVVFVCLPSPESKTVAYCSTMA